MPRSPFAVVRPTFQPLPQLLMTQQTKPEQSKLVLGELPPHTYGIPRYFSASAIILLHFWCYRFLRLIFVQIFDLVAANRRTFETDIDEVRQDGFKVHPVFLEQRKEKFREHQQHHARRRVACAKCSPCEKVERNTDGCRKAHTDELPLCQVEKDLVFDFGQVFRDRYISHSSP